MWTQVDGTQKTCGSCHGNPPPAPHPPNTNCNQCHPDGGTGGTFSAPAQHIDGDLDVSTACNACHGSTTSNAPPKDTSGNTATTTRGVGAHQAHVLTGSTWHKDTACAQCHTVPASVTSTGHIDSALPAELTWSGIAAGSTWNGTTCTSYCHGSTLTSGTSTAGGTATSPQWTKVDGSQKQCTSCHGNPPPAPHPQLADCGQCHADVQVGSPTTFSNRSMHIDGTVDVTQATACNACHGGTNNAPPKDTSGNTATTSRGVGAHQAHVLTTSTWHKVTTCDQCHKVPTTVSAVGHIDTALPAELTWTGLAAGSTWNGTSCTSYCHGKNQTGGAAISPVWTKVDGTQKQCTSCHGNPPPAPHPANTACTACHPDGGTGGTFTTPGQHIDGTLQVSMVHPTGYGAREMHGYDFDRMGSSTCATSSCHGTALTGGATGGPSCNSCHNGWQTQCTFCHGGTGNTTGAPPAGVLGATAATDKTVGAHAVHVTATATHAAWDCTTCHTRPSSAVSPGHIDGTGNIVQAEVTYSTLNPSGTYTTSTATCANLYCHGTGRTSAGTASWTSTTALTCSSCHSTNGNNMSGEHQKHIVSEGMTCSECHQSVIASGSTVITTPALHVNGAKDVKLSGGGTYTATTKSCSGLGGACHGTKTW